MAEKRNRSKNLTDESIEAIAQMLGGENPSEAALASAREMKAMV